MLKLWCDPYRSVVHAVNRLQGAVELLKFHKCAPLMFVATNTNAIARNATAAAHVINKKCSGTMASWWSSKGEIGIIAW